MGNSAVLAFTVTNTSTLASALHFPGYGLIPGYNNVENWENSLAGDSGPMSPTTQSISWTETVSW